MSKGKRRRSYRHRFLIALTLAQLERSVNAATRRGWVLERIDLDRGPFLRGHVAVLSRRRRRR